MSVVNFPGRTKLDLEPDRILEAAYGQLEGVVVCGVDKNGALYFASSFGDEAQCLWLLRRSEHLLMKVTDEMEGRP